MHVINFGGDCRCFSKSLGDLVTDSQCVLYCRFQIISVTFSWWNFDRMNFRVPAFYENIMSRGHFKIVLLVSAVLPIAFCASLLSLLHFHSFLSCKGMTTFDWILAKRRKDAQKRIDRMKARKDKETEDIEAKRHSIVLHQVTSDTVPVELDAVTRFHRKYSEFEEEMNDIESPQILEDAVCRFHTKGLIIDDED